MILLKKHTLEPKNYFRPEAMALNLEERNSTATLTLGPEAPEIGVNDWVQDDTEPGKGIVWRVKSVRTQVETQTRTVQLEHVIQYLKDRILWGEVTPKTITGKAGDKCTAKQAINYALGKAGDFWKLGDLCENPSNPYSFNGDTVFAALETVTSSIQDAQWEFDYSSLPFKLHIRRAPDGFQSEMRMNRNITNLSIQIDRTRMYTRHYPIGKNNLHIDGSYTSKNEKTWGVVCKVETDNSLDTKAKLKAWSLERLNRHCEPLITVTVGGLDLSRDTGESLDRIRVGRRCRLPLPEYGTTVLEKVTKMSWADKVKDPIKCTVTLANTLEDVASIVNSLSASSSRSSRAGAKKDEDDHAWIVDTDSHIKLVAEAVAGPGAGEDWSRVAELTVDGEGIHQRVTRTEGEIVTMWSSIDILEDRIVMEVANAKSDTYSKIEQTASSIRLSVNSAKSSLYSTIMQTSTNIYTQVGNAKSGLYSSIEQTANSIRTSVSSAKSSLYSTIMQTSTNIYTQVGNAKSGLYSSIEQTASQITLKADKTYVDGELEGLTAKFNSITVEEGGIRYLSSGKVYATTSLHVGTGTGAGSGTFYYRGTAYYPNFVVLKNKSNTNIVEGTVLGTLSANNSLDMTHYHEIEIEEGTGSDAGKMFVTLGKPSDQEGSANFKIADTTAYKSGVLAARNAVKVKAFTANAISGNLPDHRTFTYTTNAPTPSGSTPQEDTWYLAAGGWNTGTNYVYLKYGSASGTNYARVAVTTVKGDISIPTTWSSASTDYTGCDVNVSLNKNYTYHKFTVTVHGVSKTVRVKLT